MIDIHSHILPGIDDGAKSVEDSLEMAKVAIDEGIHTIIATPHHKNGEFQNKKEDIIIRVNQLNKHLEDQDLPLKILPGQETRINGEMVSDLEQGHLLPLNINSGYVFVELPSDHVPRYTDKLLFDLQVAGYKPIIVHPERNQEIIQYPDQLYKFVKNGTLTQVTTASICGRFGKKIKKFTHQLIESNLTQFISSDAHNITSRGFYIKNAYEEIKENYGDEMVFYFMENSELLVEGKIVVGDVPERVKRKKLLGLF